MPYQVSLDQVQKTTQNIKQLQRLIMTPQMQQAILLLQMPIMELTAIVEAELEQNPILNPLQEDEEENGEIEQLELETKEIEQQIDRDPEKELNFDEQSFEIMRQIEEDFFAENEPHAIKRNSEEEKLKVYLENSILFEKSLFETLMQQAHETFESKEERLMAENIIGNLDQNGFLKTSLEEIAQLGSFKKDQLKAILDKIKTFEPHGVGAETLQESLLIQLKCKSQEETLAFRIVQLHFEDLLQNHIPVIIKSLNCSSEEVTTAVEQIAKLNLHPGTQYSLQPVQYIVPDVTIRLENDHLGISVNDDYLPSLHLNLRYMKMLKDPATAPDVREFIIGKLMSAKWLIRNIFQRNDTIEKIALYLAKHQKDFFLSPQGKLIPLTMKMIAEELNLHESTIARAVSNKYINSPRGLYPLRYFFSTGYVDEKGADISAKTVQDVLREVIENEDKSSPYSDEEISAELKKRGISCARRTIAKYRVELNFGNAHQRKKF